MNFKALARYFYARTPGLAAVRFVTMDLASPYFVKPEYRGVVALSVAKGLMVDVGANRGQSIAAFKNLAPESNIVAFEPEPKSAERLALRYRRDPTVTIHGCALGERATTVTFFVPTYGRWDCDGMSATDRNAATEWLRDPGRMLLFNEAKLTVKEHRIECRTLDSYKLAPLLIKLHAQGDEFAILKGSKQTIRQYKPALMCAFPSVAVTELLSDWGYRPCAYYNGRFVPGIAKRPATFTWYLTKNHARQVSTGRPASVGWR
jgi:FkbM family methyltransferase